jgi:hypothetical protein
MKNVTVTGLNGVLNKLKIFHTLSATKIEANLKKAGLFVQRESQLIVPIDKGPLKASARTEADGKGFKTHVIVHYGRGVNYAVYVHENMNNRHKTGKRAKYLEAVCREKKPEIFDIVAGG